MTISRRKFLVGASAAGFADTLLARAMEASEIEEDVVVIGAGGAGLAAAVAAAQAGLSVTVLEKMSYVGGNTLRSSGAFNAVRSQASTADSQRKHYEETFQFGGYRGDPNLVRTLVARASETIEWLTSLGIRFEQSPHQAFGGITARAYYCGGEFGSGYIQALTQVCRDLSVRIVTDSPVVALNHDDSQAWSIDCKSGEDCSKRYKARKGLIVASGGYSSNTALCSFYDPRLTGLMTTNHPGATGDLLAILQKNGAMLTGVDYIQLSPAAISGEKVVAAVSPVHHFVFVDSEGNRFVDEASPHNAVAETIFGLEGRQVFSVYDARGCMMLRADVRRVLDTFSLRDGVVRADTIEALAIAMGVPVENLRRSVTMREKGNKGRQKLLQEPPFYAVRLVPAIHYTMGGVQINRHAQVISREGAVIPGLFAAGEVTGGVHGINRLGGNGITDAFVFGRIAGMAVAGKLLSEPLI